MTNERIEMTSKTIRIDTEVYEHLQSHAQPLSDTPNTVLRRLLGIDKEKD